MPDDDEDRFRRRGVLVPPALKGLAETTAKPLAYALCKGHAALTMDELGDMLTPGWHEYDLP